MRPQLEAGEGVVFADQFPQVGRLTLREIKVEILPDPFAYSFSP